MIHDDPDWQADFKQFFHELTGNDAFPWQEELFHRLTTGVVDRSLDIPTGLGKTAVMAIWLLARVAGAPVPRRLVYIVDRRAVVDQATKDADKLREAVKQSPELTERLSLNGRSLPISTLRGQYVDNTQWLEDPSSPAIIVGTIDMIGSRLLFEGYGVSRKMRPYHAGLLGADTLFVLDEAHLVPPFEMLLNAIASNSAGVQPRCEEARTIVPQFKLMCLSATGRARSGRPFTLTKKDFEHPAVRQRLAAKKRLILKPLQTEDDLTLARLDELLSASLAAEAWQVAERGTRTVRVIVFCDKRKVAEAAKKALEQLAKAAGQDDSKDRTELFVGGRRVRERQVAADKLQELGFIAGSRGVISKPTFVFATSAAEVGVDLDADHMVSDLVAWERMVQRLGRVNRRGNGDAEVVVLIEPDPRPGKAAKAAIEKDSASRDEKETELVESHLRKVESARAKREPFEYLARCDAQGINASPEAIRELTTKAESDEALLALIDAATTPEPLRPALTRSVVDAWSMTALKEHAGRPEIGPWLRGWVNDEPQTSVVWRKYLPTRDRVKVSRKEIEAFFEAAPPHTSEILETESDAVMSWLTKRAEAISKQVKTGADIGLHLDEPFGFVFSPDGDLRARLSLTSEGLHFSHEAKRNDREEDADKKSLRNATLIVNARFAGLLDGLLDPTEKNPPQTADNGSEWLPPIDGESVIRFRIRPVADESAGNLLSADPQWRTRLRFPTSLSGEGEAAGWLVIEKWRSDSTIEEDRSVGRRQLLEDHQTLAEKRARELATRLGLSPQYAEMLAIAARLHDEGKRALRWQRAFNAPDDGNLYAKTPGPINFALLDGYRHEFRSIEVAAQDAALLKLPKELQELTLHMIAAHHGFGRPVIEISGCDDAPPSKLEPRARKVSLRFARLQQRWGPWGLAWWESLLRAVDHQASRENEVTDAEHSQKARQ
ncbi:MAG: type I-G CRISPR-associated helicase/endonuclease Cas3g [Planctomycetaceae bacterium]